MAEFISSLKKPFGKTRSTELEKQPTDTASTEVVPEVGEQDFIEDVAGGLGRHLGVFSTTSLMYRFLAPSFYLD